MTSLSDITALLDRELKINDIKDFSPALNGLQVENNGSVTKVALAVDGSQQTIDAALAADCDLLLLHHGLFWSGLRPITGWWKHKIESCLSGNLAVYSAHLPLDMHPTLGNNAGIARGLGLTNLRPELSMHGECIGLAGDFAGSIAELKAAYEQLLGGAVDAVILSAPNTAAGRVVVCSGAAGDEIYQVQERGYRCFLTGETNHWVVNAARDMGISIFFGGHYATETFGVKALGALLNERFKLPTVFIDNPTGF